MIIPIKLVIYTCWVFRKNRLLKIFHQSTFEKFPEKKLKDKSRGLIDVGETNEISTGIRLNDIVRTKLAKMFEN